jgi:hypothetical protein
MTERLQFVQLPLFLVRDVQLGLYKCVSKAADAMQIGYLIPRNYIWSLIAANTLFRDGPRLITSSSRGLIARYPFSMLQQSQKYGLASFPDGVQYDS